MPPGRPARQRAITNENDENASTIRLTRAKAAALADPKDLSDGLAKKPLQVKKGTLNTMPRIAVGTQKKRAALGDVSNVAKNEIIDVKDGKKTVLDKGGLAKAAQTSRVQKHSQLSRTNSTRSVLSVKDRNSGVTELKRPASGAGLIGHVQKKRTTTSSTSKSVTVKDDELENNADVSKNAKVTVQVEQTVTTLMGELSQKGEALQANELAQKEAAQKQAARVSEESKRPAIKDLDSDDIDDPLMVAEYVHEIFSYLRKLEEKTMPNPNYMEYQKDLEWKMRGILIDWLIEVHTRFHLLPETLFLCVNIIDRFLSQKVVQLDRLQLVGVTAMFIASKYEEVLSPHVTNFRHVADDGFSDEEILAAERFVLSTLEFDLSYPNPMNFLRRISKADGYCIQTRTLAKYLIEISLLDHRFMDSPPSLVAAAAMFTARLVLRKGSWNDTLSTYAGYDELEIEPVFLLMIDYLAKPVQHEAFFKKYASKRFLKASIICRQWAKGIYNDYFDSPLDTRTSDGANGARDTQKL